ncbi:MAG: SlyX family protein [Acidobacteriota bacterium]
MAHEARGESAAGFFVPTFVGRSQIQAPGGAAATLPTMEDRIIELETRVAYQEKLISELDDVVRVFADRVERAERRILRLESERLEAQEPMEPHNTKPPHY